MARVAAMSEHFHCKSFGTPQNGAQCPTPPPPPTRNWISKLHRFTDLTETYSNSLHSRKQVDFIQQNFSVLLLVFC